MSKYNYILFVYFCQEYPVMEYLETTAEKKLDDILAESKGRYGASNLIMFITAEELHKFCS